MIQGKVSFVALVLLNIVISQNAEIITEQLLTEIGYDVKTTTSIHLQKGSNVEDITGFDGKAFTNFNHLQKLFIEGGYTKPGFNFSELPQEIFRGLKNIYIYSKN